MNNFSGILYRIWGVCGIMILLALLSIFFAKPWKPGFTVSKIKTELIVTFFAVCLGLVYLSRIIFPDVSSYTGVFVEFRRNSSVAPPLPLTYEYVFWNGDGKKKVFYLDAFSKKVIFSNDFVQGQEYTIFFDEFTKIITQVEDLR